MTSIQFPATNRADSSTGLLAALRRFLGSRRGILVLAAITVGAGLALGWGWLVAAGLAPVVLALLPCLVMCGLGLCMNKATGASCEQRSNRPLEERRNTHA